MSRVLAVVVVLLSAGVVAGCGGSHRTTAVVTQPLSEASQPWVQRVTRTAGGGFGDAHATVSRFETVQLAAREQRADVLELRGNFHFLPTCPPGSAGHCLGVVRFHNVQAVVDAKTHKMIIYGNDVADAELADIQQARRASPLFRSFPDLTSLIVDCSVPSQLVPGGVDGTCSTWAHKQGATTRVVFIARWPLSKPSGTRRAAGWAVTVGRDGRVVAVHVHREGAPQLWR